LEWITSIYNNINPHTGLPIDLLDGLNPGDNRADFTWFSDVAPWAGLPYVNLVMTPLGGRDIITRTEDSWWFEIPGRTRVELCNAGEEDIIIVTYVEYPNVDYHGENPICVEKARKTYKEYEKVQVKIPQVRWAGEKIVIEKDWGAAYGPGVIGQCVTFTIDQDSIGTLVPVCGMDDGTGNHVETWVMEDGVARVIFESEYEGQAEVKCVLYDNYCMDCMGMCPLGLPIDNHDFPLFYLAIESIEVLDGTPKSVDPFEDAYFGVQVKGWFHNKATYDSSRPVGWLDLDPLTDAAANVVNGGDGIPYNDHEYKLPEGRWVMPDDWPTLAGFYEDNPQWDLMNNWEDRDFGIWSAISPSGPFNSAVVTTIFPGLAEFPVIGPFNTTQPVAIEDELIKWVTTASVIADYNVEFPWLIPPVFPPPMPNNNDWTVVDLRNTVVPDGKIEWFDCPMPPAKVIFQVADDQLPFDLFAAGKFWLEPYSDIIAGIWYAPYYSEEIPSSWFIPKGAVPEGYSWDSWGAWTQSLLDDCPYPFWLDLNLSTLPATDDEVIEVYSDNNGRAHVGMWALGEQGEVIIRARVDYPYMGKYSSVGSREVTQRWGAEELNPWFLADKTVVDVFDTVTFTNETTFGQHPYTRAEWDFNDDGVADIVIEGTEAQVMADVTWAYDAAGVYNVKLTMRDSAPTTRWEVRLDYITVSGGGILLGDANQDGVVNALDITYIEMIIAGLVPATPEADANQDGVVNALDITATEIIIAG